MMHSKSGNVWKDEWPPVALLDDMKSLKKFIFEDERNCKNTEKNSIFESSWRNRLHLIALWHCWQLSGDTVSVTGPRILYSCRWHNFENRNSEVLHSSSTLISLGSGIHEPKMVGSRPIGPRTWRVRGSLVRMWWIGRVFKCERKSSILAIPCL